MLNKITLEQCKDTGLAFTLIFLIITWLSKNITYVAPAIIILILTMTCPKIFKPLAHFWFGLSHFMGEFVSKILLSVVFFLILFPIGMIRKSLGKDSMRLKEWKNGNESAFQERNIHFSPADLEKPF